MFIIYFLWKSYLLKSNFARTLIILSTIGNTVYIGFPFVNSILGEKSLGFAAIVTSIHNFIMFTFGFIFINFICEDEFSIKLFLKYIFRNIVFLSSIIAVLISYFSIPLPFFILNLLGEISKTTLPLSLFTVGVALYGKKIDIIKIKQLFLIFFFKIILLPLIAIFLIYILNLYALEFKVSFIEYAMPVAVLAFVVAKKLEIDSDLVAQAIVFTTIGFAIISPLIIYFSKQI